MENDARVNSDWRESFQNMEIAINDLSSEFDWMREQIAERDDVISKARAIIDWQSNEIKSYKAFIAMNTEFLGKIGTRLDHIKAGSDEIINDLRDDECDLSADAKAELEYDGF